MEGPSRWQERATINNLAGEAFTTAAEHGFHEDVDFTSYQWQGMQIALMHSELSEALEAVRAGNLIAPVGEHSVEEELADLVIRVLHVSCALSLNIGRAVIEKMEKNRDRPYKHGKVC